MGDRTLSDKLVISVTVPDKLEKGVRERLGKRQIKGTLHKDWQQGLPS